MNPDGSVTASLTLPRGVRPDEVIVQAKVNINGTEQTYPVRLARGKANTEFHDRRTQEKFCKISSGRQPDGSQRYTVDLYNNVSEATIRMQGHASQTINACEVSAEQFAREQAKQPAEKNTQETKQSEKKTSLSETLRDFGKTSWAESQLTPPRMTAPQVYDGSDVSELLKNFGQTNWAAAQEMAPDMKASSRQDNDLSSSQQIASNTVFVSKWTPPEGSQTGFFPIAEEDRPRVDVSRDGKGLTNPAGLKVGDSYRFLRTAKINGTVAPGLLVYTPPESAESKVEQRVSSAISAHVDNANGAIRFNTSAAVEGEPLFNDYQYSQVRSDGSLLFSQTEDIMDAQADLHIAAPLVKGSAVEWAWIPVARQADGRVIRR
jgi:hypothetical protein